MLSRSLPHLMKIPAISFAPPTSPSLWFVCGPTVYSSTHLGHARTYLLLDSLSKACNSKWAMGITDVDNKIVNAVTTSHTLSKKDGNPSLSDMSAFTRKYEADFFNSLHALNVSPPYRTLRVSEHIPEIISSISALLSSDAAYKGTDGSIYMSTATSIPYASDFPKAKQSSDSTTVFSSPGEDGSPVPPSPKRSPRDFALWKLVPPTSSSSSLAYDSPFGRGRPGWHIECSAFVQVLDASSSSPVECHGGGIDLQFPHHTNEMHQSRHLTNSPWIKHWTHTGHVEITGQKMSKSLKNFITVSDIFEHFPDGPPPTSPPDPPPTPLPLAAPPTLTSANYLAADTFRLWCLGFSGRWNARATFSWHRMHECLTAVKRIVAVNRIATTPMPPNTRSFDVALHDLAEVYNHKCRSVLSSEEKDLTVIIAETMKLVAELEKHDDCSAYRHATSYMQHYLDLLNFSPYVLSALPFANATMSSSDQELVELLKEFRGKVREEAMSNGEYSALIACDWLRDHEVVKTRDIAFVDNKVAKKAAKPEVKVRELGTAQKALDTVAPDSKDVLPLPRQVFSVGKNRELYSAFEADGIPSAYMDGEPIQEEEVERLKKEKKTYTAIYWARKSMRH